jgi:hypothetical protein
MSLDPVEIDLKSRYSMDTQLWRATNRSAWHYSTPLEWIIGIPLVLPLLYLLLVLGMKDYQHL